MTANPLKIIPQAQQCQRTALEWARGAREKGLREHEKAWLEEARRRGEV